MGMIGNAPYGGTITGGNVADGSIETVDIKDKAVTAAKLGDTAIADKLGYTPANKAGDTFTGNVTGRGLTSIGTTSLIGSTATFQALALQDGVARDAALYLEANCADNSRAGGVLQVKPDATSWRGHLSLTYMADGTAGSFKINQFHPSNQATYTRLMLTPSGVMTVPEQPAFYAYHTVQNAIAAGVTIAPIPNAVRHNRGNCYNTSNGRFTAPVTGTYMFITTIALYGSGVASAYLSSEVYVNGTRVSICGWEGTEGGYDRHQSVHVLPLNAGDYAQLGYESAVNNVIDAGSVHGAFQGYLIG